MVGNRSFFISLGTVLLVLLMASPIIAGTVTYLYSDSGDIPLYRAISNKTTVALSENPEGGVILAIDLNYGFMNESSRETLPALLKEAQKGKTVIVGLNTLRSLTVEAPTTLRLLGISVNFTTAGIVEVKPKNGFKFKAFGYDSDVYGVAMIKAPHEKVIINSSGIPVLVEIPVGKGKLVVLTINPSAYYLDTKNPAVVDFIVAVIEYYSKEGLPLTAAAAAVILSAGAAYATFSNNPHAEKFRRWIKWIPLAIGRFMIPPEKVLKNKTRESIYRYIEAKGYSTVVDVASTFSISRTNARWHLNVLKRAGLLDETTIQNTTIYHPPGRENRQKAVRAFLLENKIRREIYNLLIRGKSISDIARTLGLSKSTVHHHVSVLREYGVVGNEEG